jgi:hypothetical protein
MIKKEGDAYRTERLAPGSYQLHFFLHGYDRLGRIVHIEPGRETDLGDVEVPHEQWISGTVVDDKGNACAMEVSWWEYDRVKGRSVMRGFIDGIRCNADGSFRIGGLSRGSYVVSARAIRGAPDDERKKWAEWCKLIDTTSGPVENVRIQLARPVTLIVRASNQDEWRSVKFKIVDESGFAVRSSPLWTPAPAPFQLSPGRYTIEVRAGDAKEPKRIPITLASEPVELALP